MDVLIKLQKLEFQKYLAKFSLLVKLPHTCNFQLLIRNLFIIAE